MEPNAYLHHGDPLEAQAVVDNARLIDTEWSKLPDKQRQKEAIENAFRVVLLSPQKDLWANTLHYQDLQGIHSTDPVDLWNTLEKKRQEWNVKNFGEDARFSHRPYSKALGVFENIIFQRDPEQGWRAAKEKAKHIFFEWETQAQEKVMDEQKDLPPEKQMNHYEIENAANKLLAQRLKTYNSEFQTKMDFEAATRQEEELFPELEPQIKQQKFQRYPAFMGTHLKAISQVSEHADEILKAALEDVHDHDGAGHHFRSVVMQLGVPGIGPKTCSFAWLLLQPMTSQLATIDTHMADVLGKNYQKEMSNRDYFKFERELQAGRDAAGYEHIPLGTFQWGMWDHKRTGPRTHQDHSGLRVLDPTSHDAIDWEDKEKPLRGGNWDAPDWWANTQPERDRVGQEWDELEAKGVAKNRIPYRVEAKFRVSSNQRVPWLAHPLSGERIVGLPGESIMSHAVNTLHLSTPGIWEHIYEAGKE